MKKIISIITIMIVILALAHAGNFIDIKMPFELFLVIFVGICVAFFSVITYVLNKLFKRFLTRKYLRWSAIFIVYIALIISYVGLHFPLISDEILIQHFKTHRSELDAIINAKRTYHLHSQPNTYWDSSQEIKDLLKKANVRHLSAESNMRWFENPYSIEAAKKNYLCSQELECLKTTMMPDSKGLIMRLDLRRSYIFSFREFAYISKNYLYIPQVPKIDNGKLLYPIDQHGKSPKYMEVRESLDYFPDDWKNGQCFLKSLDVQWFIQMCKSY